MLNVCLLRDLILLCNIMSDVYKVSHASQARGSYSAENQPALFFRPEFYSSLNRFLVVRLLHGALAPVYSSVAPGFESKSLCVRSRQWLVCTLLLATQQTVDCRPAAGSRNRWTLSGSWARQANKPASGHCWLMQNLPLVLPHSSTVSWHWEYVLEKHCIVQAVSIQCCVQCV